MPLQKGWTVVSSRPAVKSKPMAAAAPCPNKCCRSSGKSRSKMSARGFRPEAAIAATRGTNSCRQFGENAVTSAVVAPGSYWIEVVIVGTPR